MHAAARPTRRSWLAGLLGLAGMTAAHAAFAAPAPGAPLPAPLGPVVLSVSGQVSRTNVAGRADFDMAMLAALPQHRLATRTPWAHGEQNFSGPLLRDVLVEVGAGGRALTARALNDYQCEIPVEDALQIDVILAIQHNGAPMRVRDKGPLRIVYPFDSDPHLRAERYYARSAWQLRTLVAHP